VSCCTSTCTSMDSCCSTATTFSSLSSFYTIYASTKCCSTPLSSFDFSMNIGSIDVAPGLVYSFAHQCHLLLLENSTANVPVVSMSWIIVYTNYIFSLYAFLFANSKDDDEFGGDLTTNN
jgi:hypothetical protein